MFTSSHSKQTTVLILSFLHGQINFHIGDQLSHLCIKIPIICCVKFINFFFNLSLLDLHEDKDFYCSPCNFFMFWYIFWKIQVLMKKLNVCSFLQKIKIIIVARLSVAQCGHACSCLLHVINVVSQMDFTSNF